MPDTWELASAFVRFLLYLGVFGSFGMVLVRIVFSRETGGLHGSMVRQATTFAMLALLASGLVFALKGAAMTGEASGMTDPEILHLLWRTPVGTALVLRVVGLAVVLAGLWVPGIGIWISAAGGVLTLWSFSRVGHIADAEPVWLEAVLFLHLAGAAFWIGILSPLRSLAGGTEGLTGATKLGHRFGRIAAGIVLAWRLLGEVTALVTSAHGLTLLAKIGAVACLLGAAAANKLRFVPAMRAGDRMEALRLRRSIAVEWVAVCLVLLATAVLITVPSLPSGSSS